MEQQIINSAMGVLLPVIEKAALLAAEYSKACNRSILTAQDMQYAMKYCARYQVGVDIGSIFDSDCDSDEDEDEPELECCDEEDEPFTRYSGDNELLNKVNECYDTWDSWEPTNQAEQMLKDAVDKNMY
jgi:hypothetical protein